jgi:hypothetical protein
MDRGLRNPCSFEFSTEKSETSSVERAHSAGHNAARHGFVQNPAYQRVRHGAPESRAGLAAPECARAEKDPALE